MLRNEKFLQRFKEPDPLPTAAQNEGSAECGAERGKPHGF